jgi:hypothetical protein
MQPAQDGAGDRRDAGDRAWRRHAVEHGEHVSKVVEDAPALGALRRVVLESGARMCPEVGVEVGGHVWRRPPMISAEAQLTPEKAHRRCAPVIRERGSQTAPDRWAMNRFGADGVKVAVWITKGP